MKEDINDTLRNEGPEGVRRRLGEVHKFTPNGGGDEQQQYQTSNTLPFKWSAELQPVLDVADFVEGMLTEGCLAVVYGNSSVGKSFWCIDLGLHISDGREWNGRETDQGIVIYVALESGKLTHNRVIKAREELGLPHDTPFILVTCQVDLRTSDTDAIRLANTIRKAIADERSKGLPVRLVILDTMSRALNGGSENAEDMGLLLKHADYVRRETGVAILFVAHCGKDAAKGIRGWSGIRAAIDVEIEVTKPEEGEYTHVAHVTKERDLPDGDRFGFTLKVREVGLNNRGKSVTTCIVVHAGEVEPKRKGRETPLNDKNRAFWDHLCDAIVDLGELMVPEAGMPMVRTMKREQFRAELIRKGWFNDAQLAEDGGITRGANTVEWNALYALKRRGRLGFNQTYVWLQKDQTKTYTR